MITYLIWVNLYLTVFYVFYWLCLRRETFFQLNRIYLLSSAGLALILPLVKWSAIQRFWSPDVPLLFGEMITEISVQPEHISNDPRIGMSTLEAVYILGMAIALLVFIYRFVKLRRQLKDGGERQAFSFFQWVYIDPQVPNYSAVVRHEQVHMQQWHSLDVLFFELMKIVHWFNPVVYLYSQTMKLTHEYIADDQTAPREDRIEYAHMLVNHALGAPIQSLGNHFFNHSFIKNRIVMLFKTKSRKEVYWRFAGVLPLIFLLFAFQGEKISNGDAQAVDVQETLPVTQDTTRQGVLFKAIEVQPTPPGGMQAFMQYIAHNYKYPEEAVKAKVVGRVIVTFVVEKDGSLSDVKVVRDLGYGTGEEAVRVLASSPKWKPGVQNGKPVRVQFTLPIQLNQNRVPIPPVSDSNNKD